MTGKVARDLLQIGVVPQLHEVHHLRERAPAVAEVAHLVEQVPGWLARDARIVAIGTGPTDFAMTGRARLYTPCHELLFRRGWFSGSYARPCAEKSAQERRQKRVAWDPLNHSISQVSDNAILRILLIRSP